MIMIMMTSFLLFLYLYSFCRIMKETLHCIMPHLGKLGNLKKCCVVYIKYWALFSELLVIDTPIPLDKNSKLFCVIDDNVLQT